MIAALTMLAQGAAIAVILAITVTEFHAWHGVPRRQGFYSQ